MISKWILVIFISTGGFWEPDGLEFSTERACVDYMRAHQNIARDAGEFVGGYCDRR